MPTREEIQKEMERKLEQGEKAVDALKKKVEDAGDEASDEMKKAVEVAESALDKGRKKVEKMADASDEAFEEMWQDSKDAWRGLTDAIGEHWDEITDRLKKFFN